MTKTKHREDEALALLDELLRTYGMQTTLMCLINNVMRNASEAREYNKPDDYLVTLQKHLEAAQLDYANRYAGEESE